MNELTVIKIGGSLVVRLDALDALWSAVAHMVTSRRVVVVHGGGPMATDVARRLGHEPRMVHGRRITTDTDLRIVQWTMRGELNGTLVGHARRAGVRAVGVSGADGAILQVVKRPPRDVDGELIDFGWVGDVEIVDPTLLNILLDNNYVPVVAPLGIDQDGRLYNVNADTVSWEVAATLEASEYLLVTDTGGVRRQVDDPLSHMNVCSRAEYNQGATEGWIAGGMRVKLAAAFDALQSGVQNVYVMSPHNLLSRKEITRIVESNT